MMNFPKHLSLSIEHNVHKNFYESVSNYINHFDYFKETITDEDLKKCIELDEIWTIQIYPRTPICFYFAISYSLEKCFEQINKCYLEEGEPKQMGCELEMKQNE